jgi:hypothetical protein
MYVIVMHCKYCTVCRKLETNIRRNETARPRSLFFYIHVSVSDLYIPTIGLPILQQENRWTAPMNRAQIQYMNEEIGTVSFLGVHKSDFLCIVLLWLCNVCIRGMTFRVSQYTENHSSKFKIPVD